MSDAMNNENFIKTEHIPLSDAARILNTSRAYVNVLVHRRRLKAVKLGRNWFTTNEWLLEYQKSTGRAIAIPPAPSLLKLKPRLEIVLKEKPRTSFKFSLTLAIIVFSVFSLSLFLSFLSSQQNFSGGQVASISNLFQGFPQDLPDFFSWLSSLEPLAFFKTRAPEELAVSPLTPGTSKIVKVPEFPSIDTLIKAEALDLPSGLPSEALAKEGKTPGIGVSTGGFTLLENRLSIVEANLTEQKKAILGTLETLFNISKLLPSYPISTLVVSGSPATLTSYSVAPLVQSGFDRLSASYLTLSNNATINGSLTVSSGGTFNTLAVSGVSALTGNATIGGTLTVSGLTTLGSIGGNLVPSTDLTSNLGSNSLRWNNLYLNQAFLNTFNASSTTYLSGQLILTRAPSSAHTFSSWAPDVANSSVSDASIYLNATSSVADSNLLGIAVNGSIKFLIDAEGDVFAKSVTASGGTTLSTTTVSTLTVENNTTLGDAATDTLTVNARMVSDLLPASDNLYRLGTSSLRWLSLDSNFLVASSTLAVATTTIPAGYVSNTQGNVNIFGKLTVGTSSLQLLSGNIINDSGQFNISNQANTALTFSTNNSERMRIDNSGNVGVGTTSPITTFAVNGNGYFGSALGVGILNTTANTFRVGQCVTADTKLRRRRKRKKSNFGTSDVPDIDENIRTSDVHILKDDFVYDEVAIVDIKPGDEILSLNEKSGQLEWQSVLALYDMGKQPVYKIKTASGKMISTTSNHPYLTKYGWVPVGDLREGDEIAVPLESVQKSINFVSSANAFNRDHSIFNRKFNSPVLTDAIAIRCFWIIGQMFGKFQRVWRGGVKIQLVKNTFTNIWMAFFEKIFCLWRKNNFHENYLMPYRLFNSSIVTNFPASISAEARLSDARYAGLNVSMSSTVTSSSSRSIFESFQSTASAREINDSNFLISQAGIFGFASAWRKFDGTHRIFNSLSRFLRRLISASPTTTLGRAESNTSGRETILENVFVAIYSYVTSVFYSLSNWFQNDKREIIFDRIVSIDYCGVERVWDISVANTHNFVANGIVAHNTAFIVDGSGLVGIGTTTPASQLSVVSGSISKVPLAIYGASGQTADIFQAATSSAATAAFVITSAGQVGIGTTSPQSELSIVAGGSIGVATVSGADNSVLQLVGAGTVGGLSSARASRIQIYGMNHATTPGNILLTAGNSGKIILDNGNVGIGTTSPGALLHVYSTAAADPTIRVESSLTSQNAILSLGNAQSIATGGNGIINFFGKDSGSAEQIYAAIRDIVEVNTAGSEKGILELRTVQSGTLTTGLVLNGAGNVGIGTTSPVTKLDVQSSGATVTVGTFAGGDTSNGAYLRFMRGTTQVGLIGTERALFGSGSATNFMIFADTSDTADLFLGAGGARVITVKSSGNVGIGTTSPGKLFVVDKASGITRAQVSSGDAQAILDLMSGGASSEAAVRLHSVGTERWRLGINEGIPGNSFEIYDSVNSLTRLIVKNDGNVGIDDTTPAAKLSVGNDADSQIFINTGTDSGWTVPAIVLGQNSGRGLSFVNTASVDGGITANAYYDGAWKYVTTNPAHRLYFDGAEIRLQNAPSGTAGNAITWGDALDVNADGTVAVISVANCNPLKADATGVLNCSSDERLKDISGIYTTGLSAIDAINPILFTWKAGSGLTSSSTILGFSAQNIQSVIPEAVTTNAKGYLQLSEFGILAAVVNSVKELNAKISAIATSTLQAKQGTVDLGQVTSDMRQDLNMNGFSILNVKSITGMNGLWRIDEGGNLTIQDIKTKNISSANGFVTYDKVTGQPYCIEIKNGQIMTAVGYCQDANASNIVPASNNIQLPNQNAEQIINIQTATTTLATDTATTSTTTEPVLVATTTPDIISTVTSTPETINMTIPVEAVTATPFDVATTTP